MYTVLHCLVLVDLNDSYWIVIEEVPNGPLDDNITQNFSSDVASCMCIEKFIYVLKCHNRGIVYQTRLISAHICQRVEGLTPSNKIISPD